MFKREALVMFWLLLGPFILGLLATIIAVNLTGRTDHAQETYRRAQQLRPEDAPPKPTPR